MSLISDVLSSLCPDYGTTVTITRKTVREGDDDFTSGTRETDTHTDQVSALVLEATFARQFLRNFDLSLPTGGTVCIILADDLDCLEKSVSEDDLLTVRDTQYVIGELTALGIGPTVEAYIITTKKSYEVNDG